MEQQVQPGQAQSVQAVQQPAGGQAQPIKKKKSSLLMVLILVLILGAGVGLYFLGKYLGWF